MELLLATQQMADMQELLRKELAFLANGDHWTPEQVKELQELQDKLRPVIEAPPPEPEPPESVKEQALRAALTQTERAIATAEVNELVKDAKTPEEQKEILAAELAKAAGASAATDVILIEPAAPQEEVK